MPFIQTKSNLTMFYNIVGTGDKTIVMIHGAGSTSRHWPMQLRALVKAGFRVLTYDNRGHGATPGTEGLYSIELLAQDLEELLEALGIEEKVCLCGICIGGLSAQEFMIRNPDKVTAAILSNTYSFLGYDFIAAAVGADPETLKQCELTPELMHEALSKGYVENWDAAAHMMMASDILMSTELGKDLFFDDMVIQTQEERIKTKSETGAYDSRSRLEKIKCPVLIIGSDRDMIVPFAESAYLHEHIAGSRYVVMENMNHVPTMDAPEIFNRHMLDFLTGVYA